MTKEKRAVKNSVKGKCSDEAAVLTLTIDGSHPNAEVRELKETPDVAFETPCSISGLMAGLSGGTLGYAFGFCECCSLIPYFNPIGKHLVSTHSSHYKKKVLRQFYNVDSLQWDTGCGTMSEGRGQHR